MNLHSKAEPADADARAVFPAFGGPSGGLWYNSQLEQPADSPHLVRCLHCAALNGRSATQCWSCEAELSATLPLAEPPAIAGTSEPDLAALAHGGPAFFDALLGADQLPTVVGAGHAPDHADEAQFHALAPVDTDHHPLAAFTPAARTGPSPRRVLVIAGAVVFAVVSGTVAYVLRTPPPFVALDATPLPGGTAAAERWAGDAGSAEAGVAGLPRTVSPEFAPIDAAPPAAVDPPGAAALGGGIDPNPATAAVAPPPADATTTRRAGTSARHRTTSSGATLAAGRAAARGTRSPEDIVVPAPDRSPTEPARPVPARPGPCTATVAALGLCTPPSSP